MRGHTTPTLAVIAELARRGVTIRYHTSPAFQTLVEGAGADFVAYPPGCVERLSEPVGAGEHLARCLAAAAALLPLLLAATQPAPDLVMFDASALWGGILARRLGRPSVASVTTFAMNRTLLHLTGAPVPAVWADPVFERLNAVYSAGFQDHLDLMVPAADLKFVYTARAFQPAGRFFDRSYLFLGPLLDGRPRDGARVHAAGPRPLAYVSLGTLFNGDHAVLFHLSEVLADRGWQVVVSLGGAESPDRPWPEHVQAHRFVDQIGILAQADLFVTHGGMNSVSEALSHAVPMIVIPQSVDQPVIARHTANLGAAVVIGRDAVSTGSIVAALERIGGDRAAFRAAAARLQSSLTDVVSVTDAVDRLLALMDPEPASE